MGNKFEILAHQFTLRDKQTIYVPPVIDTVI